MSSRHWILDTTGSLRLEQDWRIDQMIDELLMEHPLGYQTIDERTARAEAMAILAVEKIRRLEKLIEGMKR